MKGRGKHEVNGKGKDDRYGRAVVGRVVVWSYGRAKEDRMPNSRLGYCR